MKYWFSYFEPFVFFICSILFFCNQPVSAQYTPQTSSDSISGQLIRKGNQLLYILPDSAVIYSQQAYDRALHMGDIVGEAKALRILGKAYYIKGSYDKSLRSSTGALELAEKVNDLPGMCIAYNNIGLVYLGHEQYDLALKEFLRAIDMAKAGKDTVDLSTCLFNAGICFDQNGEYTKALDYLNKAFVSDKGGRISLMALNRLGETWLHCKKYDTAVSYYKQVLNDPRAKNDNWEKSFAYAGLSQAASAHQKFDSAIVFAGQSLSFAKMISATWDAERAARFLADNYAALHRYQNAYEYLLLDQEYYKKLYNESREEVVSYLKLQQQQKQNLQLQTQSGKDKKIIQLRTILLIIISLFALLLVFVAIIISRNYIIKNRLNRRLEAQNGDIVLQKEQIAAQNQALTASNQLKDQLFTVISHDLRSPMAALQHMLEFINSRKVSEEERNKLYTLFYQQVIQSNSMLNNLLQWVTAQKTGACIVAKKEAVDLSQTITEVLSVYMFLASQKKIEIHNELPEGLSILGDKEQLKIIFQNIIANAVKFTNRGGTIRLFCTRGDQDLTLHVKDNGVGIAAKKLAILFDGSGPFNSTYGTANEKGTGIGLNLVKQFVQQNDGEISIHSEEGRGTEIKIYFSYIGLAR